MPRRKHPTPEPIPDAGDGARPRDHGGRVPAGACRSSCRSSACCCRCVIGGRHAERIALALMPAGLGLSFAIAIEIWVTGQPLVYIVGRMDAAARHRVARRRLLRGDAGDGGAGDHGGRLFRARQFLYAAGIAEKRAPFAFWTLLQGLWAALTVVFLGGDLFNLFVALELLTFAAVPLVCLDGRAETLTAALRYLLFALVRFGALSARHGAALRLLRHARHRPAGRPDQRRAPCAGRLRRGRPDDGGTARQDRPVPAASLAAARARQRARGGERRPLGAGGQRRRSSSSSACGSTSCRARQPGGATVLATLGAAADPVRQRRWPCVRRG